LLKNYVEDKVYHIGISLEKEAVIAFYELNYQKGRVIALGLYSDDIMVYLLIYCF